MDFQNAKSIVIPEGEVAVIARGNEILWEKYVAPAYTELEYIESTGTQWINTGVKLTSNHSVEIDYQFASIPKIGDRKGLFGGLESNTGRYGSLVSPTTQKMEYGYGTGNTYYQTTIPDSEIKRSERFWHCMLISVSKHGLFRKNIFYYTLKYKSTNLF